MITELGFLSLDVDHSEREFATKYHDLFNLSEGLSRLFVRLLTNAELDRASVKNMAMNALAAKSLELFQSSVILLRKGCIPAARVLCRALIETAYKVCAIQLTSDGIDRYIQQSKWTRQQKLKSIQKYKQRHPNSGIAPGIEVEISAYSGEKPGKTEPHEWATLAKMDDFHNLYYQGMSDDTHANIESLNHYFDENSPHMMSFGPSDCGLSVVVASCHRALINAIEKYAAFQGECIAHELSLLSHENDALEMKYGDS